MKDQFNRLLLLVAASTVVLSAPVPYTAPDGDLNRDGTVDTGDLQCMVRLFYALVLAGHPEDDACQSDDDCLAMIPGTYCRIGFTSAKVCLPVCLAQEMYVGESPEELCPDPEADDESCLGTTPKANADLNCDGRLGNEDINFQVAVMMNKVGGPGTADHDSDGQLNWCDDDSDDDGDPDVTDCEPLNEYISHLMPEICNLVDENCNGQVDEELGETTCGLSVCTHTVANCVEGTVQVCDAYEGATAEKCNEVDDDCDGEDDEDFPDLGNPCDSDDLDECLMGTWTCTANMQSVECVNESATDIAEVCDGNDNDCNGEIDELADLGETTCGVGACLHTISNCKDGAAQECNPMEGEMPEEADGIDNDCDGLVDEDFVGEGTLVITEITQNPSCTPDVEGEWFEVYNASALTLDLNGWELMDDEEDYHLIDAGQPLLMAPGEMLVFGRFADLALNGGVPVDYVYTDFQLNNSVDQINIVLDGLVVDAVDYDGGPGFPDPDGASMSLSSDAFTPLLNDVGDSWCVGEEAVAGGCGDLGTPGLGNPLCDADDDGYSIPGGDCDETVAEVNPGMDEICNLVDDNCDGAVDEGFEDYAKACDGDDGDLCANGTWSCAEGGLALECVNEDPAEIIDICDGQDNNCDGSVDEDFPLKGDACDGDDSDDCTNGTWTCKGDGTALECVNEEPSGIVDLCDGEDNDCDGAIDEDYPLKDATCDGSDSDLCLYGTYTCAASGLVVECVNEEPAGVVESCNGEDDDCDDSTDEDFPLKGEACDGADSDQCTKGSWTCKGDGSGVECINESETDIVEVCDEVDNDCDGEIDEDWVCCLELGTDCGGDIQCCSKKCNVRCCSNTCPEDGWVCVGNDNEMRDHFCDEAGGCTYQVTATEDCGESGPSGIYQCSEQLIQQEHLTKGCDGGACYTTPSWNSLTTCGGTCSTWCVAGESECKNAPPGEQSAVDCQLDGWYCNGNDREHRDYKCDGAGGCIYSAGQTETGGSPCQMNNLLGPCAQGELKCQGGEFVCTQVVFATTESCNGVDDNCDSVIDEFDEVCSSVCENGTRHCSNGQWGSCSALEQRPCVNYGNCQTEQMCVVSCPAAPAESCNSIDDDCNGATDETFTCTPGQQDEEACGNCGTRLRTCTNSCTWGGWGECTGQGICTPNASSSQGCGNCGTQTRSCNDSCQWNDWGACGGQGVCVAGSSEDRGCGLCGSQSRTCSASCQWNDWGACGSQGICAPGQLGSQGCGNCGTQFHTCNASCQWDGWGVCGGEGVCSPSSSNSQACGLCGTQSRTCTDSCQWGVFGVCTGQGVCTPGVGQSQGCGNCGTQSRSCGGTCQWGGWSACSGQGVCTPGASQSQACGNCGSQSRSCAGTCYWNAWSACAGQGVCASGSKTSSGCPNTCMAKTCASNCTWGTECTSCSGTCSAHNKCGMGGCPTGHHATSYSCNLSCGSCWSDNWTHCDPDCGGSFNKCGMGGCSTGYHATSYSCNLSCGSCWSDNWTHCELDDADFWKCGSGCPAGYSSIGSSCNLSCGSCWSNNWYHCHAN